MKTKADLLRLSRTLSSEDLHHLLAFVVLDSMTYITQQAEPDATMSDALFYAFEAMDAQLQDIVEDAQEVAEKLGSNEAELIALLTDPANQVNH